MGKRPHRRTPAHAYPANRPKAPSPQQLRRSREDVASSSDVMDVSRCERVEEAAQLAAHHLKALTPGQMSDFWVRLYSLVGAGYKSKREYDKADRRRMNRSLRGVMDASLERMGEFSPGELSRMALAFANILSDDNLRIFGRKCDKGRVGEAIRNAVVGQSSGQKFVIFDSVARAALRRGLSEFVAGDLSILASSFGMVGYAPRIKEGVTMLDEVAGEAILRCGSFSSIEDEELLFEPGDIGRLLWAYPNAGEASPSLFREAGDAVVEFYDLESFGPGDVSGLLLAYARAGEVHAALFDKVAADVVAADDGRLGEFDPKSLANLASAYAETTGGSYPKVFEDISDALMARDVLEEYPAHDMSRLLLAFATAGHPRSDLFERAAEAILSTFEIKRWSATDVSILMRAYAIAGEVHAGLYERMADVANERRNHFRPGEVVGVLWAYASAGQACEYERIYAQLAPRAWRMLEMFSPRELSDVAWAYAVADADSPRVFGEKFREACLDGSAEFSDDELRRLHVWQMWQEEMRSGDILPASLPERCLAAFSSLEYEPPELAGGVVAALESMGFNPDKGAVTQLGHHLDVAVECDGRRVGILLDGPSALAKNGDPTGDTVLRRRQVASLEGMDVVSLPFWEWEALGGDERKEKLYLRYMMGLGFDEDKAGAA